MSSPERPAGPAPEREPVLYHRAARFATEQPARDAYFAAQDAVLGLRVAAIAFRGGALVMAVPIVLLKIRQRLP